MTSTPYYLDEDDGYTQKAYIEAKPRLHGELRLSFRPMQGIERVRNSIAVKGMEGAAAEERAVKVCATRIVAWDLKDRKGNPVPVSAEAIGRLHPNLYFRVLGIAYHCTEGGDDDPLCDDAERKRTQELASQTGLPMGEAAVLKNAGT